MSDNEFGLPERLARSFRNSIGKTCARHGCRYALVVTDGETTFLDGTLQPDEIKPLFEQLLEEMPTAGQHEASLQPGEKL